MAASQTCHYKTYNQIGEEPSLFSRLARRLDSRIENAIRKLYLETEPAHVCTGAQNPCSA